MTARPFRGFRIINHKDAKRGRCPPQLTLPAPKSTQSGRRSRARKLASQGQSEVPAGTQSPAVVPVAQIIANGLIASPHTALEPPFAAEPALVTPEPEPAAVQLSGSPPLAAATPAIPPESPTIDLTLELPDQQGADSLNQAPQPTSIHPLHDPIQQWSMRAGFGSITEANDAPTTSISARLTDQTAKLLSRKATPPLSEFYAIDNPMRLLHELLLQARAYTASLQGSITSVSNGVDLATVVRLRQKHLEVTIRDVNVRICTWVSEMSTVRAGNLLTQILGQVPASLSASHLRASSFDRLRIDQWLDDEWINFGLGNGDGSLTIWVGQQQDIVLFSSLFWPCIMAAYNSKQDSMYLETSPGPDTFEGATQLQMPVHYNGDHFLMLHVNLSQFTVQVLDSQHDSLADHYKDSVIEVKLIKLSG
ncbi:hypothetical protein HGRIS_011689 [Hohenbuehelia grisea]|uniref:Ubiquitin-like protease family profile domain-containing protein n=1 Tax=Hohenbuehelia grisea TaxID=104357 RepID=A0ABR3JY49_9AGAR